MPLYDLVVMGGTGVIGVAFLVVGLRAIFAARIRTRVARPAVPEREAWEVTIAVRRP